MKQALKTYIETLTVGPVRSHLNLTIFPLLSEKGDTLDYLILDEALDGKLVTVTEVSEGGSVLELSVLNASGTMVLILDGEELVGAKQNRIVNTTMVGSFVKSCAGCRVESRPSVGLGTDCRMESAEATGFALVHVGQVLHLSVFPKGRGDGAGKSFARLARASRRGRRPL